MHVWIDLTAGCWYIVTIGGRDNFAKPMAGYHYILSLRGAMYGCCSCSSGVIIVVYSHSAPTAAARPHENGVPTSRAWRWFDFYGLSQRCDS